MLTNLSYIEGYTLPHMAPEMKKTLLEANLNSRLFQVRLALLKDKYLNIVINDTLILSEEQIGRCCEVIGTLK